MKISELCEPLFQYMCLLNRTSKVGADFAELSGVRTEIKGIFEDLRIRAAREPGLGDQLKKVEAPLLYFVDSIIAESELPFAKDWDLERMAFDRGEKAGDEKFFALLEETLADPSETATERLEIFYTCLGLGFVGWYAGKPDFLRAKMDVMAARLRRELQQDPDLRICPDAYAHPDTRNLVEPPARKLGGIAIAFMGLLVVLFVMNIALYRDASRELRKYLENILEYKPPQDVRRAPDPGRRGGQSWRETWEDDLQPRRERESRGTPREEVEPGRTRDSWRGEGESSGGEAPSRRGSRGRVGWGDWE